jgi:hypothetical protein
MSHPYRTPAQREQEPTVKTPHYVLIAIGTILAILALTWIFQGNQFFLLKVFAPREEAVRRQTFEESKAYNQGTVQELQRMQFEYVKASPEQKAALASIILHQSADYPEDSMPPDLRSFIQQLKRERGLAK